MYVEFALTTGAVMAAALALRWVFRSQQPQSIEFGQVSGSWLAEQKMNKHNPSWP